MAEPSDIERDLLTLTAELKRLEAEYNMFFAGRLPRPPWETRGRVEAIIKRWDRGRIDRSVDRFRFETLQSRYATFVDLWDRGMRAREEGRPGPFMRPGAQPPGAPASPAEDTRVLHVTSFSDPLKEVDKLHALYDALMDARRGAGEDVIPFHRFAGLVKDQVSKIRQSGSAEVAFRVATTGGKVSFTVRGLKGM